MREANTHPAVRATVAVAMLAMVGSVAGAQGDGDSSEPTTTRLAAATVAARAGAAGAPLLRLTTNGYRDQIAEPAGSTRPNARVLSNRIANEIRTVLSPRPVSDMFWLWGQFVDHDIDLTGSAEPAEPFDIPVPSGDPYFDPRGEGDRVILLNRSVYHPRTSVAGRPRRQINQITAFIDGSNIYGSDPARTRALRRLDGSGQLRTSAGDLLPFNTDGLENAGGTHSVFFLAGDIRANENVALTAMHTLWMREHNRQAREISLADPALSGDEIFARARARVVELLQAITYREFLPLLLGKNALGRYGGWDPDVNPGICQEFSAAAYRFGHSMVPARLRRLNRNNETLAAGHLKLRQAFFAPQELTPNIGIEPYLRGASRQRARRIDNMIVDDLRNFLFDRPGAGGFDLAALNIQRGRDHGLTDYNGIRVGYGLRHLDDFSQIAADPRIAQRMRELYRDVDDIDLWIGGLAEAPARDAMVGPTFQAIIADQFRRLRDGDPAFYAGVLSGAALREVERTTLADVIRRNTRITTELRDDVFRAR